MCLDVFLKRSKVFEVLLPLLECRVVGSIAMRVGILHVVIAPVEHTLTYGVLQVMYRSEYVDVPLIQHLFACAVQVDCW